MAELAAEIEQNYRQGKPVFVGVLKGSFVFMSDLVRAVSLPLEVDFISVSSYGAGTRSSGEIELLQDLKTSIEGRDVLVVEDIIDTGLSLNFVLEKLSQKRPASLKVCALLNKPSRRKVKIHIDYCGFVIPDRFVVGYGLDFNEQFRNLPEIYILEE